MIHEEICSFGLSKLAKEAGFPQDPGHNDHSQIYCWDGLRNIHSLCKWEMWYSGEYNNEDMYAAPTQSLLQRWLREEKGIDAGVVWDNRDGKWLGYVNEMDMPDLVGEYILSDTYASYELALEDALKHALENLV